MEAPQRTAELNEQVYHMENAIGTLLRIGVMLSVLVIVLGTVVSFTRHPEYFHSAQVQSRLTSSAHRFSHSLGEMVRGLGALEGRAVVTAGLLLLIATPVFRVAASIVLYLKQRDWRFFGITLIVFTFLMISFLLGKAG